MFCITVVYVVNVMAAPGMPRNNATGKPRHSRPTPSRATNSRAVERKEGEEAEVEGAGGAAGLVASAGLVRLGCGVEDCV